METVKGKISVHTENIFPIIKKSLYSHHEVFLRELVSNAVDAIQKLKTLSSMNEFQGELGHLQVRIELDKEAQTLKVIDNGIGMTAEEIEKYINQIAFSGATEFVEQYSDKMENQQMIGHFGLGFYSAFMVSKQVDIDTLSFKTDSIPAKWSCIGSTDFEIGQGTKTERGTTITLHIADDSLEFLEESRINEILNKYCKFLPIDIIFGKETKETEIEKDGETVTEKTEIDKVVNHVKPLWTKAPADITDEEYKDFYNVLYPFNEAPLFWIHLNVDYPFNLNGILYFPAIKSDIDPNKTKIMLYSNQVFITDSVEEIVPDYLRLLHGVIDSPDIPLNVSRSFLQTDSNVKKINSHISKKVADKLNEIYKENKEEYLKKWEHIEIFLKYGALSDEKFYDRIKDILLFKTTKEELVAVQDYLERIKINQTDKNDSLVILYTMDSELHNSHIKKAESRGYEVLLLNNQLDNHFLSMMEQKLEKTQFKRVDSETIDQLISKDEKPESILTAEETEDIKKIFEGSNLPMGAMIKTEPLATDDMPVVITRSEFMRRMKDMQEFGQRFGSDKMPDFYDVVVNTVHPSIKKMTELDESAKTEMAKQMIDLAMLSQGMLKGERLTSFIDRSLHLMN